MNRFAIRCLIDRNTTHKNQSKSEEKGCRQIRAAQENYFRRKKVRKRNLGDWKLRNCSVGISLVMEEWQKSAVKLINPEKKTLKKVLQRKGESCGFQSEKKLGVSRLYWLRSNDASDGDCSSKWRGKEFPDLKFLNWERRHNGKFIGYVGWTVLIGQSICDFVSRRGKGGARRAIGRKEVYGYYRTYESRRWSVVLVLRTQFSPWQVIPSSLAYLNATMDPLVTHNHPSLFSFQQSYCLYVLVSVLGYIMVRIRNLFHLPSSISVNHMEKDLWKMVWGSEIHISNNISISSSTNQSGINTQGQKVVGIANLDESDKTYELNSMEGGIRTPQVESLDVQLEKIRLESLEFKKSNSIMGFVCGNTAEFKKIKVKLMSIWRLMRGEVQIYERGHGWFECIFRDTHFLNRVWNGRPYHVMGHLLLLRPWRVDFSTKLENTNVLDLWIRIFHLPSTLACHNGVKLILEENGLGKFIKFDRASGGFFARACVNIDIDKHVPGDVRISDNEDHPLLLVWFEDFPHGCGNCGELDHAYKNCPLKRFNPKKISITIVRKDASPNIVTPPTEKDMAEENEEGWVLVNNAKKKRPLSASTSKKEEQLSGRSGGVVLVSKQGNLAAADQPVKEVCGGEVFSSPTSYFKEDNKEEGEVYEEIEALLEKEMVNEDQVNIQDQEKFIEELERDMLISSPSEMILKMKEATPSTELVDHNTSNSDSLKRKGEKETSEDTDSSSLKRKKSRGIP